MFSSSGKKKIQTVFRSVYNFKMDHILQRDAREKFPRRRPEVLIHKYKKYKLFPADYDKLPAEKRTLSLFTFLDLLGNL